MSEIVVIADRGAAGALAFTRESLLRSGVHDFDVLEVEPRGLREIAIGFDSLYALKALEVLGANSGAKTVVVRAGTAVRREPRRLLEHAAAHGLAAPRQSVRLRSPEFQPSLDIAVGEGLGVPEVIAVSAQGRELIRRVEAQVHEELEKIRFDAPYLWLANLWALGSGESLGEPTVLHAACLGDTEDVSEDCEFVCMPHWGPRHPWVPDGRYRFPAVTAVGRPCLESILNHRAEMNARWGPDTREGDDLRTLARVLVAEGVPVERAQDVTIEDFRRWLSEPDQAASLETDLARGLYLTWRLRADLRQAFPNIPGDDERRLWEWGRQDPGWAGTANSSITGCSLQSRRSPDSRLSRLRIPPKKVAEQAGLPAVRDGVLVFGLLNTVNGLGNVARDMVSTLRVAGADLSVRTWVTPSRSVTGSPSTEGPPRTTAIAIFGAQSGLCRELPRDFMRADRRIGIVYWEIDCPVPGIEEIEQAFTEIWAPTEFLAGVFAGQTSLPVRVIPQHTAFLDHPDAGVASVSRDDNRPYVLFMFDHYSVLERKNPMGVIDAFTDVVGSTDGPRLVIKSINGERYRREHAALVRYAARYPHVEIRDGVMDREEVLRLAAGASTYVSLHRGEGLGLTIAEAMAMGVPAVATAYGGNVDFMRPGNAHLVAYRQVPVGEEGFPYPEDAMWAEPDRGMAAAALRSALLDADSAALGHRGREDVLHYFSRDRQLQFLRGQGLIA